MTVTISRYDLRPHVNVQEFLDQIGVLQHFYRTRGRHLQPSIAERVPLAIGQWIDNPEMVTLISERIINNERLYVEMAA